MRSFILFVFYVAIRLVVDCVKHSASHFVAPALFILE